MVGTCHEHSSLQAQLHLQKGIQEGPLFLKHPPLTQTPAHSRLILFLPKPGGRTEKRVEGDKRRNGEEVEKGGEDHM